MNKQILLSILFWGITTLVACEQTEHQVKHVKLGKRFSVNLEANKTTGYSWSIQSMDDEAVQLKKYDYKKPSSEYTLVGVSGQEEFVFQALKPGRTEIIFEYKQPWSKAKEAAKIHKEIIEIKQAE